MGISLNIDLLDKHISKDDITNLSARVLEIHKLINNRNSVGGEMLGWLDYKIPTDTVDQINFHAEEIRKKANIMVVIGVGGSYCGTLAILNALQPYDDNFKVLFAGHNLSSTYLSNLLAMCDKGEVVLNVVSKSGTTTEPAIAFRILRDYMEKRYGIQESAHRIYATTDAKSGKLRKLAEEKGYQTFEVPQDIGGRYSVLTPVGLLPLAASGIDISELVKGYQNGIEKYNITDIFLNPAYLYGVCRHILYNKGKVVEFTASFEPQLENLLEWHKQLFGESEGKEEKGILPSKGCFTRDLHAIGQYIQQGSKILFETVINVENKGLDLSIPYFEDDIDGFNYISSLKLNDICDCSVKGTALAHYQGGVPVICINLDSITPYNIGELIYFFQKACAISGYLLNINPFDQPGVEAYKLNTKKLIDELSNKNKI